ncbi:hypothetical protein DPMN_005656 [Dreissena polymorpha]|uniref:Reverse transcriptase domain-containing protein n=1 Tax=Dreissena polymorpha TaxID=45954 RepID=A0A9D4RUR1_DREPO|nr:hypothetical protein DPMN_005656 [Dreissena polymorpha]
MKSADAYALTIRSILNGGRTVCYAILTILNAILKIAEVPKVLKVGLLTPVFKNKGCSSEATNYRGITVLPAKEKLFETVIKFRIVSVLKKHQSVSQRGFTANTSPLHAELIVEEIMRNFKDSGESVDLIL